MNVGVVGLGLIGGSFAKAFKEDNHKVYAFDSNESITDFAILSKVVDEKLDKDNMKELDFLMLSIYPEGAKEYLKEMSPYISKNTLVMDSLGTKREICKVGFELADKYGYTFVGGHPMAGTHNSGFKYSRASLFKGASMVIVPPVYDNIDLLDKVKEYLAPCKFGGISVTTAYRHDEMIAFTSQLAHVVSNAYIKSPTANNHKGLSAGSYKDLTRVAYLNAEMWSDLFLENGDNLVKEIDYITNSLSEYSKAIKDNDRETLIKLLNDGKNRKIEVDGR